MFTREHLYYTDLRVGAEWVSPGRTVTQSDIVNFAGVSGDFNSIHMDHHFAATTPFRKPVAHGLLVLSMASGLVLNSPPTRTLAFLQILEWNFTEPVFIGDTIRVHCVVESLEERARGRRGLVTWKRQIFNQENKLVQWGRTQVLLEGLRPITEPHPEQRTSH
ncbi:MAG: MaoC/PaaZ C-terminal domain-containing protein [Planctomycetota bacterium]|nr:MaoC/PaaZ C-terminal domain-containing protein [Planctomycetota bacterium]